MNLLYATAPAAVAAAAALGVAIPALVRRARLDRLATLAVAAEQRVELPAGEVVLHLAGRLGTAGLGALSFELVEPTGATVPTAAILVRSRRTSLDGNVLLAVRRFQPPQPGVYRLRVGGLDAGHDLSDCRLVLARPQDAGLVLAILAVVISAVALVACSVLSLLLWLAPGAMAA